MQCLAAEVSDLNRSFESGILSTPLVAIHYISPVSCPFGARLIQRNWDNIRSTRKANDMSIISKVFKLLTPILYGLLMFKSYEYIAFVDSRFILDFFAAIVEQDWMVALIKSINPNDRLLVASLPFAVAISFAWVFMAKYIPTIREKISQAILWSVIPLLYLWGGLIHLNFAIQKSELAPLYPKDPYLWATDTLAVIFLPYYFMILIFKWILFREKHRNKKSPTQILKIDTQDKH